MKKSRFFEKLFAKSIGNEKGDYKNLDREKKDMIRGVVELSESIVKEIMVPRIDVVFVHIDTPIDALLSKIAESRHSRVPMYSKTIDNVIGILHVKDLVPYLIKGKDTIDIQKIIREPFFVPESKKLNSLLKEFKKRKVHIAVVVDEYGGTSGVVCLEDIIEEIVGDIQDEFDNETEDILKIGEGIYLCDARANIQDLNEKLNLSLLEDNSDTLGGFVFDLFGKIPVKYEKVTYKNIDFIIQDMNKHKILTIKIIIKKEN